MKTLLQLVVLLFSMLISAQEANKLNFSQTLEKAQTGNKNVLLYFSGSDWCAPCVKFKKQFVLTEQFKSYADNNLVVYNADFPRLKKNQLTPEIVKENETLAEKYNRNGLFPLILLLNKEGKVIKSWDRLPSETLEEFIAKLK